MTSLLPRSAPPAAGAEGAGRTGRGGGPGGSGRQRSLVVLATLGGVLAASASLAVCLLVAVVGWFVTDAGAHGAPRDALGAGGLGWLVGHGSGIRVQGAVVTLVPLGVTLLAAWVTWRVGHRVGDALSGHGPDADRIADGERDWTVPVATALLGCGYVLVVVVTATLAADAATAPSTGRAVAGALLLCLAVGGTALAVGSGRAAIWLAALPPLVRSSLTTARSVLLVHLAAAGLLLLVALLTDVGEVLATTDRLAADAGDAALVLGLCLLVLPNALLLAGSWALGPGFTVGTGTVVSPGLTVLGALPVLPLVPALPAEGALARPWVVAVVATPFLLAAVAVMRAQRRAPTLRWDEGVLRGCAGGVLAGLAVGLLAALAGGAVGPGRMAEVGPLAGQVLAHAVAAFGLGGALGGAVATGWQRRRARRGAAADPAA